MIYELVSDLAEVLDVMPQEHLRFHILTLLDEAIRRNVQFIHRHREDYSQALFQTLWNHGWWHDSPQVAGHYVFPQGADQRLPPWAQAGPRVCDLITKWREQRAETTPGLLWLRALRPPVISSDTGLQSTFRFKRGIAAVAICRDNTLMVSATRSEIHLTNLRTGEDHIVSTGISVRLECIALSPDGSTLAAGFADGTVGICEASVGSEFRNFARHHESVRCIAVSPCGKKIATSAEFEGLKVWQMDSGKDLVTDCGEATTLSFSADGHLLTFGSENGIVGLWDLDSEDEPLLFLEEHDAPLDHVAFSADGSQLGSVCLKGRICIRNLHTGEVVHKSLEEIEDFRRFRLSPALDRVACGSLQGSLRLVDLASGTNLAVFSGHDDEVSAISFMSDGQSLASASWDKTIQVWKVRNGDRQLTLKGAEFKKSRLTFAADGSLLACLGDNRDAPGTGQGNAVLIWDVATGRLKHVFRSDYQLSAATISHDNRKVAAGTLDDFVLIWNLASEQLLISLRAPYLARPKNVVFSQNDKLLAAETWQDYSVWIWDTATGESCSVLRGHSKAVQSIAFNHDSSHVLTGGDDRTVRIWDTASGDCMQLLRQSSQVLSVAFAANGKWIACGMADGSTCVWDVTSSAPSLLYLLVGHSQGVERVWYSPSSSHLLSATKHSIRIWNLESGQLLREIIYSNGELSERSVTTGSVLAAMPVVADQVITNESGELWAAAIESNLVLARLEIVETNHDREK